MGAQIAWLCACVGAVWFSGFFPEAQRQRARWLAIAVLVNWLAVQTTYTAFAPQLALGSIGLHYSAPQIWAFFDFLLGLYVVTRFEKRWLEWFILAAIVVQELCHDGYKYGLLDASAYLDYLDAALGVILLLFVIGGAKGVADGVYNLARGSSHLLSGRLAGVQARLRKE